MGQESRYTVHAYDDVTADLLDMKALAKDATGFMWLSTSTGLYRFDGYTLRAFRPHECGAGDGSDAVTRLATDARGTLWCEIDRHAYTFDTRSETFRRASHRRWPRARLHDGSFAALENPAAPLHRDRFGRLWRRQDIAAEGLIAARSVLEDDQDNVWYIYGRRLMRISFHALCHHPLPHETQPMRWAMRDRRGRLWLSDRYSGRLTLYAADNSLLGYITPQGRVSRAPARFAARPYAIYEDRRGRIWVGTKPDGLFRLTPSGAEYSVTHFRRSPGGLNDNEIIDITEDGEGRLWTLGFRHGPCCYTPSAGGGGQFTAVPLPAAGAATADLKFRKFTVTRTGALLAATSGGLIVYDLRHGLAPLAAGRGMRLHTSEPDRRESLTSSALKTVMETAAGQIIVCSRDRGINLLTSPDIFARTLSFRHYDTRTGFPADYIKSIFEADGRLWVTALNNIIEWNPTRPLPEGAAVRFTLAGGDFSESNPVCRSDGSWVIGTLEGAVAVRLSDLRRVRLSARRRPIPIRLTSAPDRDTLTLRADERTLNVAFAALAYGGLHPASYAVRLTDDGDSDAAWQYLGSTHNISFQRLSPGEYTLELRTTDTRGEWQRQVRRVTVIVTPQFSETLWARLLWLALAAALVAAAVWAWRYVKRVERQRRETLDAYMQLLHAPTSTLKPPPSPRGGEKRLLSSAIVEGNIAPPLGGTGGALAAAGGVTPPATAAEHEEYRQELLSRAGSPRSDDRMIKGVVAYIEEHLAEPDIDIDSMARAVCVSRSGLNHKLKQLFGVTPSEMIRAARIKRACQLLADGSRSVNDIAYACGFSDPKYFSRCFKSATGHSPSGYRLRL